MRFLMTKRVGDARFPHTNYKASKYCIAYLDILGGTDIIRRDDKSEHLNIINMIFHDVINESKIFVHREDDDIFVKVFSDNILIAIKTDTEHKKSNIEKIIGLVSDIIQEASDYGYLLRGAITEGDFFCNDIFVYGKALLDVIDMESKYAIYPRVIVKKEIANLLPQYFYVCADGWYAINYYILDIGAFSLNYKITLLKQLKNNKKDKKVRQKIMFAITDLNIINGEMRKIGALNHQIITHEEIENAVK